MKGVKYLGRSTSSASVNGQVRSRALQLSVFANAVNGNFELYRREITVSSEQTDEQTLFTMCEYFSGFVLNSAATTHSETATLLSPVLFRAVLVTTDNLVRIDLYLSDVFFNLFFFFGSAALRQWKILLLATHLLRTG